MAGMEKDSKRTSVPAWSKTVESNPKGDFVSISLRSKVNDDSAILYCSGQLIAGEEGVLLRRALRELFEQRHKVVVDLANIDYIDSNGLSVLVGMYPAARTAGATIKYVNLATPVDYRRQRMAWPHEQEKTIQTTDPHLTAVA